MESSCSLHKACREYALGALVAAEGLSPRPCIFAVPKCFSLSICMQIGFHQQNACFPKAQIFQPYSHFVFIAKVLQEMK